MRVPVPNINGTGNPVLVPVLPKDKFPVPVLILVLQMRPGSGPVPGKPGLVAN